MPKRKELLVTGEIYHVYNRSVANQEIFMSKKELARVLALIDYYRFKQSLKFSKFNTLSGEKKKAHLSEIKETAAVVEIYAYALMSDHYHLLIKQKQDKGIKDFVSNFQNGFAKYYNLKNENRGSLFINPFKAKRIVSEEVLIHVSRYIHLNPVTSYLFPAGELSHNLRTSYPDYLTTDETKRSMVNPDLILGIFGNQQKYQRFLADQVDYQRQLGAMKKFVLE